MGLLGPRNIRLSGLSAKYEWSHKQIFTDSVFVNPCTHADKGIASSYITMYIHAHTHTLALIILIKPYSHTGSYSFISIAMLWLNSIIYWYSYV